MNQIFNNKIVKSLFKVPVRQTPPPPLHLSHLEKDGHEKAKSFFMAFSRLPVRLSSASFVVTFSPELSDQSTNHSSA